MLRRSKWYITLSFAVFLACLVPVKAEAVAVTKRLYGQDRYQTAVAVSKDSWQFSNYAVLVNGQNYPDALSAAPLAKRYNCPILLTDTESLNVYSAVELRRLNVKNVFIIGGTGVVSTNIEDKLKSMGISSKRLWGQDRYGTALAVAKEMGDFSDIVLANGHDFYDTLSIAPIAAKRGMPIILTDGGLLPDDVKQFISGKNISKSYIVGGEDIISSNVTDKVPNVKRIYGSTKFERNINVINEFPNDIDYGTLYIASGNDFPDALSGAAVAPRNSSPIILVDKEVPFELKQFFSTKLINKINVLGGSGAVAFETENAIKSLPIVVSSTNNITDVINQNQSYNPPKMVIVSMSDGTVQEVPVNWNLTRVDTTKPGIFTFKGTIDNYPNPVTLSLMVKPIINKIEDLTADALFSDTYIVPQNVSAEMSDGSISNVPVVWSYPTTTNSKPGVYVFQGKVEGYSKTIKLTLTVNPNPNQDLSDIIGANDITDEVLQGDTYKLPSQVTVNMKDGSSKKYAVTWDSNSADTSVIGTTVMNGTLKDYNVRVKLILTVKPKILYGFNTVKNVTRGYNLNLPGKVMVAMSDNTRQELPVTWNLSTVDTSAIGNYTVRGKVVGYDNPVTYTINVVKDYIVTFNDVRLQNLIRSVIGKPIGSIYKSDIEAIKSLDARNLGIADISGLGNISDLTDLKLDNNNIVTIDELATLTDIKLLSLSSNKIVNINQISKLVNLTSLNFANNKIKYLNALEDMNQLESLYLSGNPIADYSPIIYYYKNLKNTDFSF